ncbi:MAG: putative metallopeptidase [Pirellulales bacterium]
MKGGEGTPRDGFNFTHAMRRVCEDMVERLPDLDHIDLTRVAFSFTQARKSVSHGLYASLTPMRFVAGNRQTNIRGRSFRVAPLLDSQGREILYILSFCLPRFLNVTLEEKLSTVFHELWHISPAFDGDLRRHSGRCYAHGRSQREYDRQMDQLAQRWLALDPPAHLYGFLQWDFDELVAEYGPMVGTRIPAPKLIPG